MDMQSNHWEEENWKVYHSRYKDSLLAAQHSVTTAVEVLPSRSGTPTMRVTTKSGQNVFLHSSVDPVKEAQRAAGALKVQGGTMIVVYGLALGYLAESLLEQHHKHVFLFVVEPDQTAFEQAMKARDLRKVLTSDQVYILVGNSVPKIQREFSLIYDVASFHDIAFTGLSGHMVVYDGFYQEAAAGIKQVVDAAVTELQTMAKIGPDLVSSTILNFYDYCTRPGVNILFGKFAGIPAIIVAAGPSLNRNIKLLHEAKGRAVIIAVGTAVKALQKHDIVPDFIVSVDPLPINYEHFKGYNAQDAALLADVQSYPAILQAFQGPIFVGANQSFISNWTNGAVEDKGNMESGGTAAHSAMTLAYNMKADPIIFVGQDLAFARDGHTHAEGTNLGNHRHMTGEDIDHFYITANDGGQILTHRVYNQYRLFIEQWVQANNDRVYINATEGGALIQGLQIMTLQEALAAHCNNPVDVQALILQAQQQGCKLSPEQVTAILYRRLADSNHLLELVTIVLKKLRQLQQAFEKKHSDKMQKYSQSINKTFAEFEQDTYIRPAVEIFAHHTIHHVLYRRNKALYANDNNIQAALKDYDLYYRKISEGIQQVKAVIQQAIKYAEGHN